MTNKPVYDMVFERLKLIVVTTEEGNIIGVRDTSSSDGNGRCALPWSCSNPQNSESQKRVFWEDMKFFKRKTLGKRCVQSTWHGRLGNIVVMGSSTWASIPRKNRPLPYRRNFVLTRSAAKQQKIESDYVDEVKTGQLKVFVDADAMMEHLMERFESCYHEGYYCRSIYVIGGRSVYEYFLKNHLAKIKKIYVSTISKDIFSVPEAGTNNEREYIALDILDQLRGGQLKSKYERTERYFFLEDKNEDTTRQRSFFSLEDSNDDDDDGRKPAIVVSRYTRVDNEEENGYLNLLAKCLRVGKKQPNARTGIPVYVCFGETLRFDVRNGRMPVMTTKRVFWRGAVEEMLFFLSGNTDTALLEQKGVKIWRDNTSREFLDARGLRDYKEGDMGPTYGFMFRHSGAEHLYRGCDYLGSEDHRVDKMLLSSEDKSEGFDQVEECLRLICTDPTSRRIMINLWSAANVDKMSLPPCLFNYIFFVDAHTNEISVHCTMRSADLFLGVPFNVVASTILLNIMCIVATNRLRQGYYHLDVQKEDTKAFTPGDVVFSFANAHVYENHVAAVETQLKRCPLRFPTLKIVAHQKDEAVAGGMTKKKTSLDEYLCVEDFASENFIIEDYYCDKTIKADMAV